MFRAGTEYGIVNVLGCARKPTTGFAIGGPEAAGAANIFTAIKEERHKESYPVWVREEVRRKALRIRWQDDITNVVDKALSRMGWRMVREAQAKNFYHEDLELTKEEGETKAFGFEWATATGIVKVRSACQYEEEEPKDDELAKELPVVQGRLEFGDRKRKLAAAYGRIARVLDMTNMTSGEVQRQVARVLLELRRRGHAPQDVETLRRKTQRDARVDLSALKNIPWTSTECAARAARTDDFLHRAERSIEQWSEDVTRMGTRNRGRRALGERQASRRA